MTEKRKFLIARIDRIGDTVLATPIPRELKRSFPGCEVSVLVRSYTRDIFTGNPFVDNILVWDDFGRGLKKIMDLGHFLRYYRFTDIFMLLPNETLAYASVIGGIKRKFGTSRKLYHLLTGTKTLTRGDDASVKSEAAWCLEFVKAAGGSLVDDATEIHLTDEEKNTVSEIRKSLAPKGERIIGVHVTSGGSAPNMPPEEYLKLIEQLTEKAGVKVVVTDN
ncbi:MAG: lipopolysaccharide heptosyltransferase family protein, partial [Chlorobiota bacterium]